MAEIELTVTQFELARIRSCLAFRASRLQSSRSKKHRQSERTMEAMLCDRLLKKLPYPDFGFHPKTQPAERTAPK